MPLGISSFPKYVVHFCNAGLPQVLTILGNTLRSLTTNVVFGTGRKLIGLELNKPG